jgi:DNA-binding NarL/FixJ family response regulator
MYGVETAFTGTTSFSPTLHKECWLLHIAEALKRGSTMNSASYAAIAGSREQFAVRTASMAGEMPEVQAYLGSALYQVRDLLDRTVLSSAELGRALTSIESELRRSIELLSRDTACSPERDTWQAPTSRVQPSWREEAAGPDALSERESTVLELLSRGLSDKEIGTALSISRFTASKHVSSILTKLQVASRTEAAVAAIRGSLA